MSWEAKLNMRYVLQEETTQVHHSHEGPLRIMRSIYPEGSKICHNIIVHPPGGLVEGDRINIKIDVEKGAHALISTPGATRFYSNQNEQVATQHVQISLADGARLEWLPLESIAYPDCWAENSLDIDIQPGGAVMAWDVTALGLPQAGRPFEGGHFFQRIRVNDHWLESGLIDGGDLLLMDSPLGLNGHRCMGTLICASGSPVDVGLQADWVQAVRSVLPPSNTPLAAGATWPNDHVLVLRVLGPMVEPVMLMLQSAWSSLRREAWKLPANNPRIWSV